MTNLPDLKIEIKNPAVMRQCAGPQLSDETDVQYAIRSKIAQIVLDAMFIREAMFDKAASDTASAEAEAHNAALPADAGLSAQKWVHHDKFYTVNVQEAYEMAASAHNLPHMGYLLYLAGDTFCNDAEDWATGRQFAPATDPDDNIEAMLDREEEDSSTEKPDAE